MYKLYNLLYLILLLSCGGNLNIYEYLEYHYLYKLN